MAFEERRARMRPLEALRYSAHALILDVNYFKRINGPHGDRPSDNALKLIALVLEQNPCAKRI